MRPNCREARILEKSVLGVGSLAIILQTESASHRGDRARRGDVEKPVDNVERVRSEIRDLTAGVIPEPTKVIQATIRIVRALGRRAEPKVPIQLLGRLPIRRAAETRHHVSIAGHAYRVDRADVSFLDQLAGAAIVRSRALLRADLDDAPVPPSRVHHPFSLANKQSERLFDVDILARYASQHRL